MSREFGEIKATLEMMPRVTDWDNPAGLPMAKQTSPISTWSEFSKIGYAMAYYLVPDLPSSVKQRQGRSSDQLPVNRLSLPRRHAICM